MSGDEETAIVEWSEETALEDPTEILFDLTRPPEDRVNWLVALCDDVAERDISRMELDEDCPWIPDEEDNQDRQLYRAALRAAEVHRRSLEHIFALVQLTSMAEVVKAHEIEQYGTYWVDSNGQTRDLYQELRELMPDAETTKASGRARQLKAFIEAGHQVFLQFGIPPERVALMNTESNRSMLSAVSPAVNRVLVKQHSEGWSDAQVRDELEEIIDQASTLPVRDFVDWAKKRYRDPLAPRPIPIYFTERKERGADLLALEMEQGKLPRVKEAIRKEGLELEEAQGDMFAQVTPRMVAESLQTGSLKRIMRLSLFSEYGRGTCYEALRHNQKEGLTAQFIMSLPGVHLLEAEVERYMGELVDLSIAEMENSPHTGDHRWFWLEEQPTWEIEDDRKES